MTRLALVGLGSIAKTHLRAYKTVPEAELVAVCDEIPERLAAEIVTGAEGTTPPDMPAPQRFSSLDELLAAAEVDCVDLCTPTFVHAEQSVRCLEAGKHVICEKPMALNVADCRRMIDAARANGKFLFIAQCIRFWPAYEVLAHMVAAGSLGRIVLAKFSRLSSMSRRWGDNWFHHTELSGGALLDLHIHDVDFLASLWGLPPAVSSVAANRLSTGDKVDYVLTEYLYPDFACVAEGGWAMAPGFPFQMAYQVLGEQGLLDFSSLRDPALMFYPVDGEKHALEVEPGSAYDRELAYFFNCIATNQAPTRVTPEDALQAVRICLAERESGMTRKPVAL